MFQLEGAICGANIGFWGFRLLKSAGKLEHIQVQAKTARYQTLVPLCDLIILHMCIYRDLESAKKTAYSICC